MTLRLDAQEPRFGTRDETGSALTWDPADQRVTYTAPPSHPARGWSARTGGGPGEIARVVRVRGTLAVNMLGIALVTETIDHFAFQSADGAVVGTGVPTGIVEGRRPCYPPEAVRAFVATVGLPYANAVVTDWSHLLRRYDGLVPDARANARVAAVSSVLYLGLGLLCACLALGGIVVALTWSPAAGGIIMALGGASMATALIRGGLRMSSRYLRARARRHMTQASKGSRGSGGSGARVI